MTWTAPKDARDIKLPEPTPEERARQLYGTTVMGWQKDVWREINKLHRAGLVRVRPINKNMAEILAP